MAHIPCLVLGYDLARNLRFGSLVIYDSLMVAGPRLTLGSHLLNGALMPFGLLVKSLKLEGTLGHSQAVRHERAGNSSFASSSQQYD